MKMILKVSVLSVLFALASCAHHGGKCCGDKGQCNMKKEKDCGSKEQCPMKKEEEKKTEEMKK